MSMRSDKRSKHKPVPVSRLFKGLLPDDYRHKQALIGQIQHFFELQSSDAVFQMVQVLNVTDQQLTLAVPSPPLVNYLRLHAEEIKQQLQQQFGLALELKILSQPEAIAAEVEHSELDKPQHFSEAVCSRIEKSATTVDDKALREAMISLARTIKK